MSVLDPKELEQSPLADLHAIASELGVEGYRRLRREELIGSILEGQGGEPAGDDPVEAAVEQERAAEAEAEVEDKPASPRARPRRRKKEAEPEPKSEPEAEAEEPAEAKPDSEAEVEDDPREGVLDVLPNGSGFMRPDPFAHSREDVYVSPAQIRRCELRAGDRLSGPVRPPRRSERYPSLIRVDRVNDQPPEPPQQRPSFHDLTPVFAAERLSSPEGLDGLPFGKGSRVAVGGAPAAGASTLLRQVADTLRERHSEIELTVVLAGVRPEEVTEWRREGGFQVAGGGLDGSVEEQAQIAEIAVERAKRAVEQGRDAALVIDSLDALPPGVARRVFGAARRAEEGGSLTIFAATGLSGEPLRAATTRIVLEPGVDGAGPSLATSSGTTRAELLS